MDGPAKDSIAALLRGTREAIRGESPRFFGFIALFVLSSLLDLAQPWAVGNTLNSFFQNDFDSEAYRLGTFWIFVLTALYLAKHTAMHFGRYLQNTVAYSARMSALTKIFSALLSFPLRWHIGHHSGESLSKLHRSAGAIEMIVGTYVWQIIMGTVSIVGASILLFTKIDLLVALNVSVMAVLSIFAMIFFNRRVTAQFRNNYAFGNKVSRICVDYLFNVVTVKTLNLENAAQRHLSTQRNDGLVISKRISRYMELKWGSIDFGYSIVLGSSLLIYFYGRQGTPHGGNIGEVYVLISYLDKIFQAIGSFTGYYSGVIEAATAYEDATEIIDDSARLLDHGKAPAIDPAWTSMKFENVYFSYVPDEQRGLRNISFEIKRNEKIAIVGPSGGGKSTLLKVLSGLISPESAHVSTDVQSNVSIEEISKIGLLIPQEPEIFSESIRYNLTMGEDFDAKELSFFISLCRLEELLAKLPAGWETNLAEKGLNLSVGEKQRVALARGLLRAGNRQFLLLDEPTSSLDPRTEKEIFHGLLYHFTNRTVITTCHRINLVPLFDTVIYIANGSIQEIGSFRDLIDRKGMFFRAWDDYLSKETTGEPILAN